jgi:hypothetical protein
VFANESLIAVQGAGDPIHGAVTVASNATSRSFSEAFTAGADAARLRMRALRELKIAPNRTILICRRHVPAIFE